MNNFFDDIFNKIILNEGGYSNDKDDAGGETYLGITRRDHPKALMWINIDNIKENFGLTRIDARLKATTSIIKEAKTIYKNEYWNPIHLDELNSKDLCYQLFDHAVNAGVGNSILLANELVGLPKSAKFSNDLLIKLKGYGI